MTLDPRRTERRGDSAVVGALPSWSPPLAQRGWLRAERRAVRRRRAARSLTAALVGFAITYAFGAALERDTTARRLDAELDSARAGTSAARDDLERERVKSAAP